MNYELIPKYENVKSYYNKAIVLETNKRKMLQSYDVIVAEIVGNKVFLTEDFNYSKTTLRHVKEFLKQNGFKAESKKQMIKDYILG